MSDIKNLPNPKELAQEIVGVQSLDPKLFKNLYNALVYEEYEYVARHSFTDEVIGSNSLSKLKKLVRGRCWKLAWITCKSGCLSYGQNVVEEYPYKPRY